MTILAGRETVFFLASLGAVMQLKCGGAALGIANNFNSLNAEDGNASFKDRAWKCKNISTFPSEAFALNPFFQCALAFS